LGVNYTQLTEDHRTIKCSFALTAATVKVASALDTMTSIETSKE